MAQELNYIVRHGPLYPDAWGEIPALIAWPCAAMFAAISYWLSDYHVLIWGGPLLIAGLFLAWHALWRDNGPADGKVLNFVFLLVYTLVFEEVFRGLWGLGHDILAGLMGLTGLVAINALLRTLPRRTPIARLTGNHS